MSSRGYCIGQGSFDPTNAIVFSEGYRWNTRFDDWQGIHGILSERVTLLVYSEGRWYEIIRDASSTKGKSEETLCRVVGFNDAALFLATSGYTPSEVIDRGVPLPKVKEMLPWYAYVLLPDEDYPGELAENLTKDQLEAMDGIIRVCNPGTHPVLCEHVDLQELSTAISAALKSQLFVGRDVKVLIDVLGHLTHDLSKNGVPNVAI